jgi:hypothetical protein
MHFWSHVSRSSKLWAQHFRFLNWCSKFKTFEFEDIILIKHNIIKLKVSMSNSLFVTIGNSLNKLPEIVSSQAFLERPSILDYIKQFAYFTIAHSQIFYLFSWIYLFANVPNELILATINMLINIPMTAQNSNNISFNSKASICQIIIFIRMKIIFKILL